MQVVRAHRTKAWAKRLEALWFADRVRLIAVDDPHFCLEDLKGDTYSPKANPDLSRTQLAKEEREFEERVYQLGVVGLVGEFRNKCDKWEHADSCWGFVGSDYLGSGYDEDVATTTIKALKGVKK